MSGICGILALDGSKPELGPILEQLKRRGPEGTRSWTDGAVALGHTLLATTPEAAIEVLPLTDGPSGCTITADVRLDNREELIAALSLGHETRTIGDGELTLRAYLQWGEDCPTHLLGDFAFAIWDPRNGRLFCARDHMGMKQFNYCRAAGKFFVFATEDTAVLAHEAVPKALNEPRIADFIADLEGFDFTSTFFEHIHRLRPAHSLKIDAGGCDIRRYWQLRPPARLELESDEAYDNAFMKVFTEAVRCRLRHTGGIGAMLSGGLDSTSIVAIAANILSSAGQGPLNTISAVSPAEVSCPETSAIHLALSIQGLSPSFFTLGAFSGMSDKLITELKNLKNPFEVDGTILRGIYLTAQKSRINVILDGGAGDVILTSDNIIAAYLSDRQFARALREVLGEVRFWKHPHRVRYVLNRLLSAAWVAYAPLKIRSLWREYRLRKPLPGASPDFARRVSFPQRRLDADKHVSMHIKSEPARRAQSILHPNLVSGRERFDQLSGTFGIECRDPFMDIRLIEFCLSLPQEQLQSNGWPKFILRRSIQALVPRAIAWRRGKEHLGWDFTVALLKQWEGWKEGMRDPHSPLVRYLSADALKGLQDKPEALPTGPNLQFFALDRFLRRYGV